MDYKQGDTVKVTLTGTVSHIDSDGEVYCHIEGQASGVYLDPDAVGIESMEKYVRPFQVGDTVRRTEDGTTWVLGKDGYLVTACPKYPEVVGHFNHYSRSLEKEFADDMELYELVKAAA